MAFFRKGLNHVETVKLFAEVGRGELRTSVGVEDDALGDASEFDCIPQGVNGEEAVNPAADAAGDHFPSEEIENDTDIVESLSDADIGEITDPAHIGSRLVELLMKQIVAVFGFCRGVFSLRRLRSAHFGKAHGVHQPGHSPFTDEDAIITRKADFNLTGAEALIGLGVDLKYTPLNLYIILLPAGGFMIYVFVVSTPVDIKNPAEDGNTVLSRQRLDGF